MNMWSDKHEYEDYSHSYIKPSEYLIEVNSDDDLYFIIEAKGNELLINEDYDSIIDFKETNSSFSFKVKLTNKKEMWVTFYYNKNK